ncbi:MAG TPA: hypothetical protein VMT32_08575 [Bryobacteraceae bacterium]|nr:hypothetical protein [Bryobacteraceae bacterium]
MPDKSQEDDSFSDEQKQLLKTLGMKALDFLVKIGPAPELAKEGYKVGRELSKTSKTLDNLGSEPGDLTSSDYSINRLAKLARYLHSEMAKLARHDENWWVEVSGVNLLQREQTTEALQNLQQQRQLLLNLQECCDGLKGLAVVAMGAAHLNIKGIAKMYMPSLVAIDGIVVNQILDHLDNCNKCIDSSLGKLENAIRTTADYQKSVDRFLALVNSGDQRKVLDAIRENPSGKAVGAGN